jgi:hypothetical protein
VAAVGLVVWNRARTGQAFGPRWRPHEPFWHHAADALASVGQWWLPSGSTRPLAIGFGVLALGVVATALVARPGEPSAASPEGLPPVVGLVPVLVSFVGCYVVYMVYARTTSGFDPLSSRLMVPIFVPVALLVLLLADRASRALDREAARVLVLAIPLLVVLPGVFRGLDTLRQSHDVGTEYTNGAVQAFLASPVLGAVPDDCEVLTDDPWLLWLAGIEAQLSPESNREVAIPVSMRLEELAPLVAGHDVCLVWLEMGSTVFHPPADLAAVVQLDRIAGDDFTTVYRLRPLP